MSQIIKIKSKTCNKIEHGNVKIKKENVKVLGILLFMLIVTVPCTVFAMEFRGIWR